MSYEKLSVNQDVRIKILEDIEMPFLFKNIAIINLGFFQDTQQLLYKRYKDSKKKFQNLEDFISQAQKLPKDLRELLLYSPFYSLSFLNDIHYFRELYFNEKRIEKLGKIFGSENTRLIMRMVPFQKEINFLYQAFQEKLFVLKNNDIQSLSTPNLRKFLCEYGLQALREQLIPIEQIEKLSDFHISALCSIYGLEALREKLITLEQVKKFSDYFQLKHLLTKHGLQALRKKIITPEEVVKFPLPLLSECGLRAIELKLITPEQAHTFHGCTLSILFTESGLKALTSENLTIEIASKLDGSELRKFLYDLSKNDIDTSFGCSII